MAVAYSVVDGVKIANRMSKEHPSIRQHGAHRQLGLTLVERPPQRRPAGNRADHAGQVAGQKLLAVGAEARIRAVRTRRGEAHRIAAERKLVFVHPYDDPRIVAGQGTIALEMLQDVPQLDTIVAPVGGGGMMDVIGQIRDGESKIKLYGYCEFEGPLTKK